MCMARAAPASARAATIISFLTAHPARGFTISELARQLGMNIASAHATLAVLSDCGFVVRDPVHRTYVLGPALAVTGTAALDQHPAIGAATERAELLGAQIGTEVDIIAIAGRDIIVLARRGPVTPTASIGYPGDRSPLLAPFGAVFMAWAGDGAITAWLDRAALSAPVARLYRRQLAEVRDRGFSVTMMPALSTPAVRDAMSRLRAEPGDDLAEDRLADALRQGEGMILPLDGLAGTDEITYTAIAAPVFDPIGSVLLSLSIAGPPHPVHAERVFELGERLAEEAAIATRQTKGRMPGQGAAGPPAARLRPPDSAEPTRVSDHELAGQPNDNG
jgi:DNA-binding IclR family transcriptional regulator